MNAESYVYTYNYIIYAAIFVLLHFINNNDNNNLTVSL